MSRVTSDESQMSTQNKTQGEDQGVLGAGLPLLHRLKLLKEKEYKEEKDKKQEQDSNKPKRTGSKISRESISLVQEESKHEGEDKSKQEEKAEPEVIGAGLPLFARLRLLKAKEEKENQEKGAKNSEVKESTVQDGKTKEPPTKTEPLLKSKLKSVMQQPKDPPGKHLTPIPQIKTDDRENINDLNKGTSKDECNSVSSNNTILPPDSSNDKRNCLQPNGSLDQAVNKLSSKKLNVLDTKLKQNKSLDSPNNNNTLSVTDPSKDKIQRSESFKKAMHEGLIKSSDDKDFNIQSSETELGGIKKDAKEETVQPKSLWNKVDGSNNIKEPSSEARNVSSDSETNNLGKREQDTARVSSKKVALSPDDNNKTTAGSTLKVYF